MGPVRQNKERWQQLCEQAATEQNDARLLQLITEINKLLTSKERLLRQKASEAAASPHVRLISNTDDLKQDTAPLYLAVSRGPNPGARNRFAVASEWADAFLAGVRSLGKKPARSVRGKANQEKLKASHY